MNKREQLAFDAAQIQSRINRALRWSDASEIPPDVPPPDGYTEYTAGWTFNAYDAGRVERGWSSTVSHGSGEPPLAGRYSSGSQNGSSMYSTKTLALRAMRCEMEMRFARILAGIDKQIEDEAVKP